MCPLRGLRMREDERSIDQESYVSRVDVVVSVRPQILR
jgi:hypothetical protein